MVCVVREEYVGMAYCDVRPTFCSDSCEAAYWACLAERSYRGTTITTTQLSQQVDR
jgi:hypothetical protein